MSNNTLEKIAKILAHAEGATSDQERDAFNEAAQRIASYDSVTLAKARLAEGGEMMPWEFPGAPKLEDYGLKDMREQPDRPEPTSTKEKHGEDTPSP